MMSRFWTNPVRRFLHTCFFIVSKLRLPDSNGPPIHPRRHRTTPSSAAKVQSRLKLQVLDQKAAFLPESDFVDMDGQPDLVEEPKYIEDIGAVVISRKRSRICLDIHITENTLEDVRLFLKRLFVKST